MKNINIKATTTEGLGAMGRKEGIASHASVNVRLPVWNGQNRILLKATGYFYKHPRGYRLPPKSTGDLGIINNAGTSFFYTKIYRAPWFDSFLLSHFYNWNMGMHTSWNTYKVSWPETLCDRRMFGTKFGVIIHTQWPDVLFNRLCIFSFFWHCKTLAHKLVWSKCERRTWCNVRWCRRRGSSNHRNDSNT